MHCAHPWMPRPGSVGGWPFVILSLIGTASPGAFPPKRPTVFLSSPSPPMIVRPPSR